MKESKISKIQDIFKELQTTSIRKTKVLDTKIDNSLDTDSPLIVKGLNAIVFQGIEKNASDIHIEPLKEGTRVRYRIDGILIEGEKISSSLHSPLISRLKIISQLDITEKRIPQDGKFTFDIDDKTIDFRVSIVPLITGEKAVIRILNTNVIDFTLENIGFSEEDYIKISKLINKKNGILLASGPTGSGKSSLIYSILKKINDGTINISTVEDPVEYEIAGINQVQYNSEIGRDFATILKAYLRQDPDVLMIGEIRDQETAEIAIKSALTGHFVLSTIHTNDAISGIFRLLNIGVERFMLSASLSGIVAQRLVRKLCPYCKTPDENWKGKLSSLKLDPQNYQDKCFFKGCGCDKCNNTGYNGRLAVLQLFTVDSKIRKLIDERASQQEIEKYATLQGMKTLIETGVSKAFLGLTSLDEVIRQC